MSEKFDLIYDCDKKAVACILLQVIAGCNFNLINAFGFETSTWLIEPTSGMRRIRGTAEEWRKIASISNAKWKGKRAAYHERTTDG
jgi:hypothetical protein